MSTSGGKGIFATGTQVRASFNITNCSTAGDETVNTSFTEFGKGFSSTGQGEGACTPATVSWSGGSFTVKTGSTQGISTTAPSMTCPFDSQQDQVQIMVRDPSTGTVLATAVYSYQILPI